MSDSMLGTGIFRLLLQGASASVPRCRRNGSWLKYGGTFTAWSRSGPSIRCRTSLYESQLHRRRGLWNGLVRRPLLTPNVSFSQPIRTEYSFATVFDLLCIYLSEIITFHVLALFLFYTVQRWTMPQDREWLSRKSVLSSIRRTVNGHCERLRYYVDLNTRM